MGPHVWKNRNVLDVVQNERVIDFDAADQMSLHYLKKYKFIKHARAERHFVNNNESLVQLIEAGVGYGVLTIEFAQRFLKRRDFEILNGGKVFEQDMALVWYARPSSQPYWKAFISAIH